jgi:hypothetical protein
MKNLEDWSKIEIIFWGFQLLNKWFSDKKRNTMESFHKSSNKQLWFYIDKRDYKLLNIIENNY